jgi:hypothetical protein
VGEIKANVLAAGDLTAIATSRHPITQGQTPPPVRHRHRSGGSLLYVGICLGLLLCHDASLHLLIGVGLHLPQMRWPSSYRSSSLPKRGSWIEGKAPSLCGRMDWRPLSVPLERCTRNVMPLVSKTRLSSRSSFPFLFDHQNGCNIHFNRYIYIRMLEN